jgi:anti-sigma B factor antagonist
MTDRGAEMDSEPTGAASQFSLQDVVSERRHRLLLSGELDLQAAHALERCLHEVCTAAANGVIVDLSGLTFMDSNGLRLTLLARELCERSGCEFMLVQGPPQVRRLFDVTGLLDRLPFQPRDSDAQSYQGT